LTDVGGSATVCPTGLSDWSDRQWGVAWVGPCKHPVTDFRQKHTATYWYK